MPAVVLAAAQLKALTALGMQVTGLERLQPGAPPPPPPRVEDAQSKPYLLLHSVLPAALRDQLIGALGAGS